MACGDLGFHQVDVLAQFSVLPLFPRSFEALQNVANPYNLERELDSIHSHLATIALQSPKKILNQAEAVVQNFSEPFTTNDTSKAADGEQCEFDVAKANKIPKIRRPGIGHKPAKFSLKPDSSQPAVSLEDAFDIDSYDDPDEYFAAYGRFERAKRELMRQNGSTVLRVQDSYSLKERPRRPGLLGRSYKNRFSVSGIFPAETVMEMHIAVSNSSEEQYATTELNDDSQEMDVTGSMTVKRGNDEILDNLLSQNLEVLDGEGATNLLQDHLKIKPIDIEILQLPDLKDNRLDDLNHLSGNLLKQRPALFDIQNLMKRPDKHSPTKDSGGSKSFKSHLSSQSAGKSPFSQISLLKKRLFRNDTYLDPFSPVQDDGVEIRKFHDTQHSERHFDDVDKRNKSGIPLNLPDESVSVPLDTQNLDNGTILDPNHDTQNRAENCITPLPMVFECSERSSNDLDGQVEREGAIPAQIYTKIGDSNVEQDEEDVAFLGPLISSIVEDFAGNGSSKCDRGVLEHHMEEPSAASPNRQSEIRSSPLHEDCKRKEASNGKSTSSHLASEVYAGNGSLECADGILENHMEEPRDASPIRQNEIRSRDLHEGRKRKQASNGKKANVSEDPMVTDCQPVKRANIAPDKSIEEAPKETNNGDRKRSSSQKANLKQRRTSLADAGMAWENGLRRSTRIRSRPLAFWKGERFLYGRIHESLATVIGMKYESPGNADGKPGLKVKSFVSDEYKELLDFVA
ncbi:hypothetical protein SAY87_002399 [Trapa incisa]|uniref:Centromere protein C n=1 Tax=Trapa incisa TaxID=236973 RepID=A0AAN7PZG5_9MYRT|nr:hypothetical protein SAY87_002399 [Trapa incisa]